MLLTKKGLVFTGLGRKGLEIRVAYIDWIRVSNIHFKKVIETFLGFRLMLKRAPNFETKEAFKKRKKEFANKIKPIMNERKEEWLKKFPNKKERKKEIRKCTPFRIL